MTNGYKQEPYPLPAVNSSSCASSGNYFLLLPEPYGGLDGVFFDSKYMEDPPDDSVIVTLLPFEVFLLHIKLCACNCQKFRTRFLFV